MKRYLVRRLLLSLVTLWGITLVTFAISRMAPGGPLDRYRADLATQGISIAEDRLAEMEAILGLDRPLVVQYGIWVQRALTLDFGRSLAAGRRPVRDKVWNALKVSFLLQLAAILVIYLVAVPIGVLSAVHRGAVWERATTLGLFLLYSIPSFFLASVLIYALSAGRPFDWFPMFGLRSLDAAELTTWESVLDVAWHLVLPVVCLSYAGLASISRYARSGMLEVIRQDYVRTARAKGLPERQVILRHVLRNGLLPVVTLLGNLLPALLGGSVIIENLFSIPGMGTLAFESVLARDYPTVMGISTLVGVATLLGYLLSDLLSVWLDPRITLE